MHPLTKFRRTLFVTQLTNDTFFDSYKACNARNLQIQTLAVYDYLNNQLHYVFYIITFCSIAF